MKRSEKLFMRSRHSGWMSVIVLMASFAIGCVSARVWLTSVPGGALLFATALAGFFIAYQLAAEAMRLSRLGYTETRWEWEREVRPKL